jgi:cyclopropane fatty-acyl-phospholipid synthase-like methyltransferase
VDSKLQTRIQRYGWDLACEDYEPLWQQQLAAARSALLAAAALLEAEHVLDVACGTGLLSFEAARRRD